MSSVFPPPLLLTAVSAAGIFTWLLIRRSSHLQFPPGPTPDPIIGNLRQMGSGNFGPVFEKWGKEYGPINHASVPQADKTANQSLAHGLLTAVQEGRKVLGESLDYEDVKHICGALYGGGSDTSTSVLQSFFLAMTIYPDIYTKARGSIDTVVGTDRLVDISDRDALPYITCVLKEVLRWGVPTPLGVPHRLTQDDLYAGYFLPKNSTVIYNVWGLTRNEDVYPNPEVFDPDRFMNPSKPEVLQHVDSVWGFGRRVCPGKIFAESNLWLVIANTIAVMDVRKATDENGNPITPAAEFDTGAIRHAKPFNCSVTYRSERARQLVADAVAALA